MGKRTIRNQGGRQCSDKCHLCDYITTGDERAVNMRLRLHYKKEHGEKPKANPKFELLTTGNSMHPTMSRSDLLLFHSLTE